MNRNTKAKPKGAKKERSYVELFAGCGGMSLGIDSAGFKRLLANELSPMAAATYAYNLVHRKKPSSSDPETWFTRLYSPGKSGEYENDPRKYLSKKVSIDAVSELEEFDGGMFVGGINQLHEALTRISSSSLRKLDLDVLSGGPPCQSFSLAGQREKENARNDLPFQFAKCAALLRPKVVLLENVSGILSPFEDDDGYKWHAWYEVAKVFFKGNYVPICTHAEAQKYGVPQRRPRFVMVAIRKDVATQAIHRLNELPNGSRLEWLSTRLAIENSLNHFEQLGRNLNSGPSGFRWIDPNGNWPEKMLPLVSKPIDVESAIDGLTYPDSRKDTAYLKILSAKFDKVIGKKGLARETDDETLNRANRRHSSLVKARFRILRLLANHKKTGVDNKQLQALNQEDEKWLLKQQLIFPADRTHEERRPIDLTELRILLKSLESKKHSQRALMHNQVAPAQLSIPDDFAHYAEDRTLTVREMARIQSFPDWFEFKGKVTTGGEQRAFEVPRYTQVGNAVPPLMAMQIAEGIRAFLDVTEAHE